MNSNTTTQGAAAGSAGAALAVVTMIIWILSFFKIAVPADAATAMVTLITVGAHFAVVLLSPKNAQVNVPVEATPNPVMVPTVTTPPTA